ncbi:MAG: DNA primase, partial [Catenulispora sp.]|nr:DNA primase [Catenulispora sp.]
MAEEPTEFWSGYAMDPVEIALPAGSGYTLRAYRTADAVTPTDVSEREPEENPFARKPDEPLEDEDLPDFDEDELTRQALGADADEDAETGKAADKGDTSVDLEPVDDEDEAGAADEEEESEDEAAAEAEEVPLFLTHKGKLLIFKSAEGLVDFVKSDAPHDLRQLAEWDEFAAAVTADEIEPADDDTYEL